MTNYEVEKATTEIAKRLAMLAGCPEKWQLFLTAAYEQYYKSPRK